MNLLLTKVNSSTETKDWQVSVFVCMSMYECLRQQVMTVLCLQCLFGRARFSATLVSHHPLLSFNLTSWAQSVQPMPGWLPDRKGLVSCGFFSFSLVNLLPSLALRHLDLAAAVSDSNTVYVVWFAWPAPPACIAPMLTYKNISFRGNLASFSCRRVSSPPEFLCVWHMYFLCHPVFYFEFTNVTLFTWCFSFILDQSQRKRLPFSGIIPYAQAPKGFHLFWLLCFLKHPFPMG